MIGDVLDEVTAGDPCLSPQNVTTAMRWLQDYVDWLEVVGTDGETAVLTVAPDVAIGTVSEFVRSSHALIERVEPLTESIRVHITPIAATDEYRNSHS